MAGEEEEDDEDWRLRGWEGWEGRRVPGRWVGRDEMEDGGWGRMGRRIGGMERCGDARR